MELSTVRRPGSMNRPSSWGSKARRTLRNSLPSTPIDARRLLPTVRWRSFPGSFEPDFLAFRSMTRSGSISSQNSWHGFITNRCTSVKFAAALRTSRWNGGRADIPKTDKRAGNPCAARSRARTASSRLFEEIVPERCPVRSFYCTSQLPPEFRLPFSWSLAALPIHDHFRPEKQVLVEKVSYFPGELVELESGAAAPRGNP